MRVLHFGKQFGSIGKLKRSVAEARPDVVHLHGCWSLSLWRAHLFCRRRGIAVVLSPHRMLEPWHIADGYWLRKLPMLLLFQLSMVRRAHALTADTAQERDNLLTLSIIPLLRRERPLNPNVAAVTDRDEDTARAAMESIYRKVTDTYPSLCMSAADRRAENILLRIGMAQDRLSSALNEEELKAARDISDESWRRIQFHAHDEGVLTELRRGAETVRMAARDIDTSKAERFIRSDHKNTDPLKTTEAMMHPLRLEEISDEEKAGSNDVLICTLMLNLRYEILHNTISKRHLCDMYAALRFTDFDEDRVMRMLSLLRMRKFARRILYVMTMMFRLEEGFACDTPLDDGETSRLMKIFER